MGAVTCIWLYSHQHSTKSGSSFSHPDHICREKFLYLKGVFYGMAGGQIATLTLLGALAFVVLIIWNWYFFHRLHVSFPEWLRGATSIQRIYALFDVIMTIFLGLEFLSLLFIFV